MKRKDSQIRSDYMGGAYHIIFKFVHLAEDTCTKNRLSCVAVDYAFDGRFNRGGRDSKERTFLGISRSFSCMFLFLFGFFLFFFFVLCFLYVFFS